MYEEIKRTEKGRFAKGVKSFGRPKGSKNKLTTEVKERFQQLVDSYSLEQMKIDLMELKPSERLRVMTDLFDFFIPKLNRTDHSLSNGDETIVIKLPQPPLIPPDTLTTLSTGDVELPLTPSERGN